MENTILIRKHICWCDSCFCACLHEARDLASGENIKISGTNILGKKIIWSSAKPTFASYMGEKNEEWDADAEIKNRNIK